MNGDQWLDEQATWEHGIKAGFKQGFQAGYTTGYEKGKLSQKAVLEKIKTEIKEWYWQADKQALSKDPCVVDAMIDLFIRTIDNYKEESEE